MKKITYCRTCDQLTLKQVQAINKKSIDQVTSTPTCEVCNEQAAAGWLEYEIKD
jgi:hypothetical protein